LLNFAILFLLFQTILSIFYLHTVLVVLLKIGCKKLSQMLQRKTIYMYLQAIRAQLTWRATASVLHLGESVYNVQQIQIRFARLGRTQIWAIRLIELLNVEGRNLHC